MTTPPTQSELHVRPITITAANKFVNQFHRHSARVDGGLWAVSAWWKDKLVGVAIVGRPISRILQDGWTCEIRRLCTDGTPNACSFLYARCRRAAAVLGFRKVITYTLAKESGSSLRAAGFAVAGHVAGKQWNRHGRPRTQRPIYDQAKLRWEVEA